MRAGILLLLAVALIGCGKGEKGDKGDPGTVGATGPAGTGTSNQIVGPLSCGGTLSQATAQANGLSGVTARGLDFVYNAVLMGSGDVWVEGEIGDGSAQVSGSAFYASAQSGATNAPILIWNDFAGTSNGGYWNISVERSTLVPTAVYIDNELAGASSRTFTFASSSCSVQTY